MGIPASCRFSPMPLSSLQRWFASGASPASRHSPQPRAESRPPLLRSRWHGGPAKSEHLANARLDFADALADVRSTMSVSALDRIAVARSLHELWHLREEVFSLVACRFDQKEAARRLESLDRHFPRRTFRGGPAFPATKR